MSIRDHRKLFFCLWVCLVAVAGGTGLLAGNAIAAGGAGACRARGGCPGSG